MQTRNKNNFVIIMLGDYQTRNNQSFFAHQLFADWLNPSTGRRSRSHSSAFVDQYQSRVTNGQSKPTKIGVNLMDQLFNAVSSKIEEQFQSIFAFGTTLQIWRKGRKKQVMVFLDPHLPSLIWFSTKNKAFLFDLTFTTVSRFDMELQISSKLKNYFVLHYFEECLPIVFTGQRAKDFEKYIDLFTNYIRYNKFVHAYPPYFSRIMKLYTIEQMKENVVRKKKASNILKVSQMIGINNNEVSWKILQSLANKYNMPSVSQSSEINHNMTSQYLKISHCCEPVKEVFQKYSGTKLAKYLDYLTPIMTKDQFKQFMFHQQRQSQETIYDIIQQTKELISFYDFFSFLLSEKSNYVSHPDPIDEDLPLTDYYCYSSHNTYLSGNQLTSDSKIQRYIQDLQGGLKCVQLDVHNDGARPIITHALNDTSFCKQIDFEETIQEINRFSEHHPNHYPIVLSIENHANESNRYKMLNILRQNFGSKIVVPGEEDFKEGKMIARTLSSLIGKIIIKTDSSIHELMPFYKHVQGQSSIKMNIKPFSLPIFDRIPSFQKNQFKDRFIAFQGLVRKLQIRKQFFDVQNPKQLYIPLAEMTKVTGMFKSPTGINNNESTGWQCTSLTNQKAVKSGDDKVIGYTKRSWLRIYPLASQIASSNYNPIPPLKLGAQIIALNTQTKDDYAWLMMSYFTSGRAAVPSKMGYIQKPQHLRTNIVKELVQKIITIKVASSNEKVSMKFYGTPQDMKANQSSTSNFIVKDQYEGFIMFYINEKFKDCLPLRYIRRGYRVLIAKNQKFRDSGIRALIHITIKQMSTA